MIAGVLFKMSPMDSSPKKIHLFTSMRRFRSLLGSSRCLGGSERCCCRFLGSIFLGGRRKKTTCEKRMLGEATKSYRWFVLFCVDFVSFSLEGVIVFFEFPVVSFWDVGGTVIGEKKSGS